MRILQNKYNANCSKCDASLPIGSNIAYEKTTGVFCEPCFPVDVEEIRFFRQEKSNKKAARYREWAEKRIEKANKVFEYTDTYTKAGCHAFNFQPGHIPFRAKIIAQNDRAYENLEKGRSMLEKAIGYEQKVAVKGDAARRDEQARLKVDTWVKAGMIVNSGHYGYLEILKVNKKTVTLKGNYSTFTQDKKYISQIKTNNLKAA